MRLSIIKKRMNVLLCLFDHLLGQRRLLLDCGETGVDIIKGDVFELELFIGKSLHLQALFDFQVYLLFTEVVHLGEDVAF